MIDFILRPIRRNFGKDKIFYRAIDDMFGFIPHNIELYKLALIHKSASIVLEDGQHINNERLEFLGDAIIESVSSDYLFIEFPDKNEGFLTQLRSKMVSRQSLNGVAKRIGLDDHVITNASNSSSQKHIYGDAFEAMMGAIYLDQGYDFVNRLLINKIFAKYLKMESLAESETDFKSRLIEWCQKNHHTINFVTTHDKTYSATHPFFYSKVLIDNIEVGHGAGESKKEAEQRAAFSVSQGFNDDDCTKLLDKLDNFDVRNTKKSSDKPIEKSPTKEPKSKMETKPKEEAKPLKEKSKKESEQAEESKPKASRKPHRSAKPKDSAPTNDEVAVNKTKAENLSDLNDAGKAEEIAQDKAEDATQATPKEKQPRHRPARRPKKVAESSSEKAGVEATEEAEKSRPEKAKVKGEKGKKSENNTNNSADSTNVKEVKNEQEQ